VTPQALERAALALPGATVSVQWGDDRIYKVGDKMFAGTDSAGGRLSLKVTDIAFEALIEQGRAIPAPYAARFKWVQFADLASLDDVEVLGWLKTAHELVAARLTRRVGAGLGLG